MSSDGKSADDKAARFIGESKLRFQRWKAWARKILADQEAMLDLADDLGHDLRRAREMHRCECSPEDACRFARERDEARAEVERLRRQRDEAVELLQMAWRCCGQIEGYETYTQGCIVRHEALLDEINKEAQP
jgi:hypothetical protein